MPMTSEKSQKTGPAGASGGYEKRDVNVRTVAILVSALLGGTTLSLLAMGWLFGYFTTREANEQPPPSSMTSSAAGSSEAPEPRLQTSPTQDLKKLRAEEDAALAGYAWVDRNAGIVRIPIERAIDLVAGAGLPVMPARSAPPTDAAAPVRPR